MGDILGSVLGSGSQQDQTTRPDKQSRAANAITIKQLRKLFQVSDLADFARDSGYGELSNESLAMIKSMTGDSNRMTLDEYVKMGMDEGKSYMSEIATPEISSALAMQGMERGGALPEALAKGAASTSLQFMSTIPGFQSANSQANQAMFNLSDAPRQTGLNEYLRRQGVVMSGFTGIPFTPGSSTTGGTSSLPLFNMFGMGGSM